MFFYLLYQKLEDGSKVLCGFIQSPTNLKTSDVCVEVTEEVYIENGGIVTPWRENANDSDQNEPQEKEELVSYKTLAEAIKEGVDEV